MILHSPWPPEGGTIEEVEDLFTREYGASMLEVSLGMARPAADVLLTGGGTKSAGPLATSACMLHLIVH